MGFKERMGFSTPRVSAQTESLDSATRIELWNTVHDAMREAIQRTWPGMPDRAARATSLLWRGFYCQPLDEFPGRDGVLVQVKADIISAEWYDVLELLEDVLGAFEQGQMSEVSELFRSTTNGVFARYLVGYRFVNREIVPVTDEMELAAVEAAASGAGHAAEHISRAIKLLSDREAPMYAKVIQESIHAVEAKVSQMTGAKILPDGLKALEKRGFQTHPALLTGWTKLYGYTSDAAGIRHALIRDEEVDEPLAVYFLVSCSAFVNFLTKIESAAKT